MNSRRDFLRLGSATLACGLVKQNTQAQNASTPQGEVMTLNNVTGPFIHQRLHYPYAALERVIDEETMKIHHSQHHATYIANLNKAVAGLDLNMDAIELIKNLSSLPDSKRMDIRNNGGGHVNHMMFWEVMTPMLDGTISRPEGDLIDAIKASFSNFTSFKEKFVETALRRFGSGWAWLVVKNGKLEIVSTANQDNPLMGEAIAGVSGKPILCLDVWEHAYYLRFKNRRNEYATAWFDLVNWNKVLEFYQASK